MKPNVVKTSKFSVFETSFKSTAVYSKVQIESSTKKDKLITLSHGKRISLRDFSLVLYNDFDVSVDFPTNNTFPSISVDSTNVFVLTESSKNCTKSETIQSNLICRASLFVKLLNLVNISTDFDLNSIMALTAMLNNRIHPCLYSTESAGIDILSALYLSEKSSCYVNGAICPSKIALREILDSPIKLSKSEAKHIINSSFIGIATASLLGCGATRIMEMMDCIAALSCDVYGVQTEPYDANHFEVNRQQRGQINSSSNLRILLENSKRVNKPLSNDEIALEYFARIPQVHGPAIDYCTSAIKSIEIELNSTTNSTENYLFELDTTQSRLAMQSLIMALNSVKESSMSRYSVLSRLCDKTIASLGPSDGSVVDKTIHSFALELLTALLVLGPLPSVAEDSIQVSVAQEHPNSKKPQVDDSSLTPEQRAKAEAKRKQKAEKAAQKQATKAAKKGIASSFIPVGLGTEKLIREVMNRFEFKYSNNKPFEEITHQDIMGILNPFNEVNSFGAFCTELLAQLNVGGRRRPKIAKGTRDFTPDQMRIREQAFATIRRVFKRHGGVEIDTPVFELKEVLTGKYGEDSKLIYDLADQGGELLSLRYDLTVPFARFLAMNSVGNIKRYHIAKVYRRDQPQLTRGRYREFYQCDFDVAGSYTRMVADSEVLTVAIEILSELPIGSFLIKLNHRQILDAVFEICGVPSEKFRTICSAVDKLDKASWSEVKDEMVFEKGLPEDVADKIGTFVLHKGEPKVLWDQLMSVKTFGDHKGALTAMEDMRLLFQYLDAMGTLSYVSFDLSLARGLDYYTGLIYEAVLTDGVSQVGSIAAGGRYDNLVGMFSPSGQQTPCVGVSIGIERVFTIMEKRAKDLNVLQASNVQVYVASIGGDTLAQRMKIARMLWTANISAVYSHLENPKFKKQLDEALERGIPYMVVFGEDEMSKGTVNMKYMEKHIEKEVSLDEIVKVLIESGCNPIASGADLALLELMRNGNISVNDSS